MSLVGLALVLGAARSVTRVEAWRDGDHFYAALVRDAPRSYRTLWLEGLAAFGAQKWGTGESLLRQAILAGRGIPGPREDLSRYYVQARMWPQAEELLRGAMPLNLTRTRPWTLLPGVYLAAGDSASAVEWAQRAAARFPDDPEVTASALTVLLGARRCEPAAAVLRSRRQQLTPASRVAADSLVAVCR